MGIIAIKCYTEEDRKDNLSISGHLLQEVLEDLLACNNTGLRCRERHLLDGIGVEVVLLSTISLGDTITIPRRIITGEAQVLLAATVAALAGEVTKMGLVGDPQLWRWEARAAT